MRVWITRPKSSEVYLGGLRSVLLWIEEPRYDHRMLNEGGCLIDRNTSDILHYIYKEKGWWSQTGSLKAKKFLKQDKEVLKKVWDKIYESLIPNYIDDTSLTYSLNEKEYDELHHNPNYEIICTLNWKRFLLEIDLFENTVKLVKPIIIPYSGVSERNIPLTDFNLVSDSFLDENENKPFIYEEWFEKAKLSINHSAIPF